MRLRVAGSSSAVPRAGSACSCYSIEAEAASLILDCGSGAVQSLRRFVDPETIDAVIISHFHPDHVFDLVPLRYLRAFAPNPKLLDVHVHPGGARQIAKLAAATASADGERFFERSMRIVEYDPHAVLHLEGLRVTFAPARHYIPAYAMRIQAGDAAIAYSADTAPSSDVAGLARGSDVFICECSLGPDAQDSEPRGHSNAREAGAMAHEAGAKHLLLTHYSSDADPADLVRAAAAEFSGPIDIAQDGLLLEV